MRRESKESAVQSLGHGTPVPNKDAELDNDKMKSPPFERSTWKVSTPVGGRIHDIDPVFSADERSVLTIALANVAPDAKP